MQKSNRTILISNAQSLTILEQARLIDELQSVQGMCCSDIALLIERSRAWVPRPENREIYDTLYAQFLKLYRAHKKICKTLNRDNS